MKTPFRRDIWLAELGSSIGSEQAGERPVLILQNDVGNEFSPTVIVDSITDSRKRFMPTHVRIKASGFMSKDSVVLLEQIRTLDKRRLLKHLTTLPEHIMAEVDMRLKLSLGLAPVPQPKGARPC